jgi:hypothetical protein
MLTRVALKAAVEMQRTSWRSRAGFGWVLSAPLPTYTTIDGERGATTMEALSWVGEGAHCFSFLGFPLPPSLLPLFGGKPYLTTHVIHRRLVGWEIEGGGGGGEKVGVEGICGGSILLVH